MSGRGIGIVATACLGLGGLVYWYKVRTSMVSEQQQDTTPNVSRQQTSNDEQQQDTTPNVYLQEASNDGYNDVEEDRNEENGTEMTDVVILHAPDDYTLAREFQRLLLENAQVTNLRIDLPDDIITPGRYITDEISMLLDNSRLIFIFLTNNFHLDGLTVFGKHTNLHQSITDPQKMGRLIPILVDDEHLSPDIEVFQPIEAVMDTNCSEFPYFIGKIGNLVNDWKQKIP